MSTEGALRVDANISVRKVGDTTLGVRSEVKNIGGIRNINRAVNYEINRQKKFLAAGKSIINETRSWDAENGCTVSMRDKEIQQVDYRCAHLRIIDIVKQEQCNILLLFSPIGL